MTIKYSVLMSVYKEDSPEFLKISLESIYDWQTRKPDEIVVVFDGPLPKELLSILTNFRLGKEKIVKYLPQEVNQGLGEALRIGTESCTGDYIFRMDADDISDSKRFEKQIAYLEDNPDIDVLGTSIVEINDSMGEKERYRVCPLSNEDIAKMSKRRNPFNHMTVCIKTSALRQCGGYKPLMYLEDYYLWVRMIASGCKMANLRESLVFVRVGSGFIARRSSKARISGWKVIQEYMCKHKMISKKDAFLNMILIRGFIYTPKALKKVLYSNILRC